VAAVKIAALTASRIPAGAAAEVVAWLDREALGLARARVAAKIGCPDPFDIRERLAREGGHYPGRDGVPLTADLADAILLDAAREADPALLAGLFAGRSPGPRARAVDVSLPVLRFPRERPPPPARVGRVESWSCRDMGDDPVATVRCAIAVPGGVALGSDYGLTLWRDGRFVPFPWPRGARREARRVEAMCVHQGDLLVATSQSLVRWDFRGEPTTRKHGADAEEGWDELRCLLSTGRQLLLGWRTGLEGGEGPGECFALCEAAGVAYAGTGDGGLHVVDGGPLRRLSAGKHLPVRHLAFADGVLHAAAGGQHHRFDGCSWTAAPPEPTAFAVDRWQRLWLVAEGRLYVATREGTVPVPVELDRPWSLAAAGSAVWIGGRERAWRVEVG